MQFSSLKSRLSQTLAQYSTALGNINTNNYWTDDELKNYLNMAQKEFCLRSRLTTKRAVLEVTQEGNTYILPDDIVEVIDVQYDGIPLDQKNTRFLESAYSGTSHFEMIGGQGRKYEGDWREIVGCPKHWYMEGMNLRLFPRPESSLDIILKKSRQEFVSVTNTYDNRISFSKRFPTYNKNVIDVYVNGVLQHPSTYTVNDYNDGVGGVKTRLIFTDSFEFVGDVTAIVWNTPVIASRYSATLSAGNKSKSFSNVMADHPKYRVSYNGVNITDTATVSLNNHTLTVSWTTGATAGDFLDVVVYDVQQYQEDGEPVEVFQDSRVSITYLYSPADMVADADVPDIPQAFHDAVWQYAVFLALTREGQQTQDYQKAAVYRDMFEQNVARAERLTSAPIDIDFAVTQPFFV